MLRATRKLSGNKSDSEVIQHMEIEPNTKILGISSPSTPDFVIPGLSAIGDIKTGFEFIESILPMLDHYCPNVFKLICTTN